MVCANGLSLRECVMCTIRSCCDKLNHTLVTERTGQGGDNPLTFLFRCAIPELIFIIRLCFYLPEMASPLLPALSLSCTLPGSETPGSASVFRRKANGARSCQGFRESINTRGQSMRCSADDALCVVEWIAALPLIHLFYTSTHAC